MKKVLKKLLKTILFIILFSTFLIILFLLIINNKKFTVYENKNYDIIIVFNNNFIVYPEFKKFNKENLHKGYEYDGYATLHLKEMKLEICYESGIEEYVNSKGEFEDFIEKDYIELSIKSLKYSKNKHHNMDFFDKIGAIININPEIRYYQNGQTGYIANYLINNRYGDKILDGRQISYYEDGTLWMDRNYDKGLLDGELLEYYSDGKIFKKGEFDKGNGIITYYTNNGEVIGTGEYINGHGSNVREGFHFGLDSGLDIRSSWIGLCRRGDERSPWHDLPLEDSATYYENYEYGKLNGTYKAYYSCGKNLNIYTCKYDGPLAVSGYYKDGAAEGEFLKYYRNGNIFEKCFYESGIGDCKTYYPDGKILREGKMNNVKEDGNYTESEFGDWNYYNEDGKLVEIFEHDSRFVGESKFKAY